MPRQPRAAAVEGEAKRRQNDARDEYFDERIELSIDPTFRAQAVAAYPNPEAGSASGQGAAAVGGAASDAQGFIRPVPVIGRPGKRQAEAGDQPQKRQVRSTNHVSPPSVAPVPSSNVVPVPSSNVVPVPSSNVAPVPLFNAVPTPSSNVAPAPSTNVAPVPLFNAVPAPSSDVAPAPSPNANPIAYSNVATNAYSNAAPARSFNAAPARSFNAAPARSFNASPARSFNAGPIAYSNVETNAYSNVALAATSNAAPGSHFGRYVFNQFGEMVPVSPALYYRGATSNHLTGRVAPQNTSVEQLQPLIQEPVVNIEPYQLFYQGTNGNVNVISLPGDAQIIWTGMQVLKHDGTRHHGVGVQPTVPVSRTLRGVAEGRDEVLERAIEVVGGR